MSKNIHQKAYQNFTLIAAVSTGNEWTNAETNKLKELRAANASVKDIAVILGRTFYAVQSFLSASQMTNARTTTPAPKLKVCSNCYLVHSYECEM
jgi:hypothetical protein